MKKALVRIGLAAAALAVALVFAVFIAAALARGPGAVRTPAGRVRNQALYVPMRDGVRIAIDVWYPKDLSSGARIPALMQATRYIRATEPGLLAKALLSIGRHSTLPEEVGALNDRGYAVVLVDARGSGASFGSRQTEWSRDEIADYGEIVDWIVNQPWSNGRVGAFGVSYEGNTADMLAATGREAVKAVAPLYDDFDPALNLVMPGGVLTVGFMRDWGNVVAAMDRNDFCGVTGAEGLSCFLQSLYVRGTKPVDGPDGARLLKEAVDGHRNYDVYQEVSKLEFPRDVLPASGSSLSEVSPFSHRREMEEGNEAMLVRVGWLDAGTVNVALSRFFTLSNPQKLEIGPWSHGGRYHTDPFLPESAAVEPSPEDQFREMVDFFDGYLEGETEGPRERVIRYYTMNEGVWKTTTEWPPAGISMVRWYFGEGRSLSRAPRPEGSDQYRVDPTATTGAATRWHTQLGGGDVVYPDRRAEDEKLLTYTSEPLAGDIEVTGMPVVNLTVASTSTDGAFHVYLEDVSPEGRVTYVTEGIFRAIHRKESTEEPPYRIFGPYHTYRREDAMPLEPGVFAGIRFELFATSVRIRAGHRLRVAIAGADAGMFAAVPEGEAPTITIERSQSFIELPMRERRAETFDGRNAANL
jgi:hypothetical protein